jgi:hypothetical protein
VPSPIDQADYDRTVAAIEAGLGREPYMRAWAMGRVMTLDQALTDDRVDHDNMR